jgi:hypothetical protein
MQSYLYPESSRISLSQTPSSIVPLLRRRHATRNH